jgi:hypothetical protein
VIVTGGEEEKGGEKVDLKVCLAGELNPASSVEGVLYQGGLIKLCRNISLHILCSRFFSILSP